MAGKVVRDKKLEEYENENYYFLWWSDKWHFPYNSLGLTDEDNSVSRTDNFVNVNVFNSVTSARVLSYRWVLHYFPTIPVGRIKIVTVYKRSIFQVKWLVATWFFVFRIARSRTVWVAVFFIARFQPRRGSCLYLMIIFCDILLLVAASWRHLPGIPGKHMSGFFKTVSS